MISALITAFLLGICTRLADKSNWLKRNPWRIGILFGILGLAADAGTAYIPEIGMAIGLQNVPAILAAFFFGPWEGIIAGTVTLVGNILVAYSGILVLPYGTAYSTLVIALYAFVVKKWGLDGKCPSVIPAVILTFFGEIFHLAIMFIISAALKMEADALIFLGEAYQYLPSSAAIAAGLAAILFSFKRGWKKRISMPITISLCCLLAAFLTMETVTIQIGYKQTRTAIRNAAKKLIVQFEDQIDYSLHESADDLVKELQNPKKFDLEFLQQQAKNLAIDEVNVFGKDGELLASSRPKVMEAWPKIKDQEPLKEYRKQLTGELQFVKQDFRKSFAEPEIIEKYIGVPFPGKNGFLQLGFTYDRLQKEFSSYFFPMFSKASIEEEGCFIVTDQSGKIVAPVAGHDDAKGKTMMDFGLQKSEWEQPALQFNEVKLFGRYGLCYRYDNMGKWRIYAFLPYTEFFVNSVIIFSVSLLVLFIICIAFRMVMLRAAHAQEKIDDMLASDMELASMIQNSELPEESFENALCRIRASMTPAKEVGGDFYDHYRLPDGRIAVTIADVSGKGVPAAIFMMKAKNILKGLVCQGSNLAECIGKANNDLNKNNYASMFVTAWVGIFNPADNTLKYVSAGHNPPLILRNDGSLEWLNKDKRQKPLAAFPEITYQEEVIPFTRGDRLFLYTDGVTEAVNLNSDLFGNERLEHALQTSGDDLIETVTSALKDFTGMAPVADDITILTLEVKK